MYLIVWLERILLLFLSFCTTVLPLRFGWFFCFRSLTVSISLCKCAVWTDHCFITSCSLIERLGTMIPQDYPFLSLDICRWDAAVSIRTDEVLRSCFYLLSSPVWHVCAVSQWIRSWIHDFSGYGPHSSLGVPAALNSDLHPWLNVM